MVEYTYDAWGNILSTTGNMAGTLGEDNPFRYRGYIYDVFTGLYFLSSRYYSPEMGRFICADGYASTGQGIISTNMFAYCNNNPVNFVDPTGNMAITAGLAGIVASINAKLSNDSSGNSSTPRVTSQPNGLYGFNNSTVNVAEALPTKIFNIGLFQVYNGTRTITTIEAPENQYAAIEPFVVERSDNIFLSSAGVKINTEIGSLKANLSLSEFGLTFSTPIQWDDQAYTGIFFDFTKLALVVETGVPFVDSSGVRIENYTRFEVSPLLFAFVFAPSSVSGYIGGGLPSFA